MIYDDFVYVWVRFKHGVLQMTICGYGGLGWASIGVDVVSSIVDLVFLLGTWMIMNMWYDDCVSWFGRPKSLLLMHEKYVNMWSLDIEG